jgi:hypothetical protein
LLAQGTFTPRLGLRPGQLPIALAVVWLVISGVLAAAALAPSLVSHDLLAHLFPPCPAKLGGGPGCALCGMTTAFLHLSRGEWTQAAAVNRAAVPLYLFSLSNPVLTAALLLTRWKRVSLKEYFA